MQGRIPLRILLWVTAATTVVLALSCLTLPRCLAQTVISDIGGALLMLAALIAFGANGLASKGRLRWFWMLQASGWLLWLADQFVWTIYDLVLQRKMPVMLPADALLFLAGAPMIAGFLLRPHREPAESSARLGLLDFLLLLLWWFYLYVSFVVSWQYPSPNDPIYSRNFDLLSDVQGVIISGIALAFWRQSSGLWKRFYGFFFCAAVFNAVAFVVINKALERDVYYTGSWYDIPYCTSFSVYAAVAVSGQDLVSTPASASEESYSSWLANLAMLAVLSLPIIALVSIVDSRLPQEVSKFRVVVSLATMLLMASLLFIKHLRLNQELRRTNLVLQEASLTDPLTGLRNRRYFSATIEADVGQALRSHADDHDPHTRDLVFYLIDADNFKEVNDQYGHDVGDMLLIELSRRLSSSIRNSDVLVRWGGEEFLIVSRYTDRREAEFLAQRVLSAVADTPFVVGPEGESMSRTCSMGWAAFPWFPDDPKAVSYEEVLTIADRGLNRAKQAGRNCAFGMLPARGNSPATTVARPHASPLGVDMFAVSGPRSGA
ncbi:MAG TPA: GGDEF domain-containing protein [Candidatus Sulfotelmatobacter sp.]|nr:GGDEF domain-containing protein [Candidatus Sulfotelmatobacter sp.]